MTKLTILRQNWKNYYWKNILAKVNQQIKDKILCLEYSQKKFKLIFHGIRETNATCEEEINNLFDTMFGDDDIHMVIRRNNVLIDIAYQLGNFRPGFNRLKLVVLCNKVTTFSS